MSRFQECHAFTAKWEGGWSDHPADPGGKTMYGVTEAVYKEWLRKQGKPARPVRQITKAEALAIYRDNYWRPTVDKYQLFPGVDLAVYDAAVNSGVSRGVKWLKASVGSNDHSVTARKVCRARLSFMQSLKIWKTFGRGWTNRVTDIEVNAVRMAIEAMEGGATEKAEAARKINARAEAAKAKKDETKAKTGTVVSGGSGVGSGGLAAEPPADVDMTWLADAVLAGVFVVAVIAAIYFVVQWRAAKARRAAYLEAS